MSRRSTCAADPADQPRRAVGASTTSRAARAVRDELVASAATCTPTPSWPGTSTAPPRVVAERLERGRARRPQLLPRHRPDRATSGPSGRRPSLLRADLDALPVDDRDGLDRARSTSPGVAHACGHDVHTAALLGAGLRCAELHRRGRLPGRVRLMFQPAEEVMPGGALDVIAAGGARRRRAESSRCTATRRADVGLVGAARRADHRAPRTTLTVRLHRPRRAHLAAAPDRGPGLRARQGGHRAARGAVPPARPARRRRAWSGAGSRAGAATNAIPASARSRAPCGCSTQAAWARRRGPGQRAGRTRSSRRTACAPRSATSAASRPSSTSRQRRLLAERRSLDELGEGAVRLTEQSLGGEDFAWYPRDGARRDGAARHPHAGRPRPTTCTRATSSSTSARSASGAAVLAAVALRQLAWRELARARPAAARCRAPCRCARAPCRRYRLRRRSRSGIETRRRLGASPAEAVE